MLRGRQAWQLPSRWRLHSHWRTHVSADLLKAFDDTRPERHGLIRWWCISSARAGLILTIVTTHQRCRSLVGSDRGFHPLVLESLSERRPGFSLEKNGFTHESTLGPQRAGRVRENKKGSQLPYMKHKQWVQQSEPEILTSKGRVTLVSPYRISIVALRSSDFGGRRSIQ